MCDISKKTVGDELIRELSTVELPWKLMDFLWDIGFRVYLFLGAGTVGVVGGQYLIF